MDLNPNAIQTIHFGDVMIQPKQNTKCEEGNKILCSDSISNCLKLDSDDKIHLLKLNSDDFLSV